MQTLANPYVDNWYRNLNNGSMFSVVAIEDNGDTIEVQYFDGDIDALSRDEWLELNLEIIDEPEDYSGSMDIANVDDLGGTNVTDTEASDWQGLSREEPIRDLSGVAIGARETAVEDDMESIDDIRRKK